MGRIGLLREGKRIDRQENSSLDRLARAAPGIGTRLGK
jgi:hypothetical protein